MPTDDTQAEWLTVKMCAARFSVSTSTVRRWILPLSTAKVVSRLVGGRRLILASSASEYVNACQQEPSRHS